MSTVLHTTHRIERSLPPIFPSPTAITTTRSQPHLRRSNVLTFFSLVLFFPASPPPPPSSPDTVTLAFARYRSRFRSPCFGSRPLCAPFMQRVLNGSEFGLRFSHLRPNQRSLTSSAGPEAPGMFNATRQCAYGRFCSLGWCLYRHGSRTDIRIAFSTLR